MQPDILRYRAGAQPAAEDVGTEFGAPDTAEAVGFFEGIELPIAHPRTGVGFEVSDWLTRTCPKLDSDPRVAEVVKNAKVRDIAVSADEDTQRQAQIRAAELDTSASALVREFLKGLVAGSGDEGLARAKEGESALERRRRLLRETFAEFDAQGIGLRMSENVPRDELYDRVESRSDARPGDGANSRG